MTDASPGPFLSRYFYQRSLRFRIVLSQIPLSIGMLLVLVVVVVVRPSTLHNPLFQAGLWLQALLLLACALVPWQKLPFPSFLVIPCLDFVAIG
ncbi:MAG: PAS domain-containing sensor histidine kinase, partial [Actinomycetota bacterium]|nr:PAS domain-containing sensor histidine kinase [Actinomycetota bacterium]